jgi:hypothetical protein
MFETASLTEIFSAAGWLDAASASGWLASAGRVDPISALLTMPN